MLDSLTSTFGSLGNVLMAVLIVVLGTFLMLRAGWHRWCVWQCERHGHRWEPTQCGSRCTRCPKEIVDHWA